MVWFHGGAYSSSGNVQYPGYTLAMRDVVVVVANYRLGILGEFIIIMGIKIIMIILLNITNLAGGNGFHQIKDTPGV